MKRILLLGAQGQVGWEVRRSQAPLADVTAYAILHLAHQPQAAGLYHLAAAGETSWNGHARPVLAHAKRLKPELNIKATVQAVPSSAFVTAAVRPHNSRLIHRSCRTPLSYQCRGGSRALNTCWLKFFESTHDTNDGTT